MRFTKVICAAAIIMIVASTVFSVQIGGKRTATMSSLQGAVEVISSEDKGWKAASAGAVLREGDAVKTGKGSGAMIDINENGATFTVELKENSKMAIVELKKSDETGKFSTLLDLGLGEALVKTKNADSKKSSFQVKTPTSLVSVENGNASFSIKVDRID